MQDNLEKFVRDNRSEFDGESPGENLWKKIEPQTLPVGRQVISVKGRIRPDGGQIDTDRKNPVSFYLKIAAVLVLTFGIGYYFLQNNSKENLVAARQLPKEIAEAEIYYTSIIDIKTREIEQEDLTQLGMSENLSQDTRQLDEEYKMLKDEFLKNTSDERVTAAMIKNLQTRIALLNKQLEMLEKIKKHKKQTEHEKINI